MIQRYFVIFILLFLSATLLEAQSLQRINKIQAKEEFRWGVFAFHNGNYSDALLSFEKSISLDPEDNLTHFWLGLSYYVLGFESEALIEWKNLLNLGYNVNLLNYWISALEVRRSLLRPFYEGAGWEVLQEIIGGKGVLSKNSRPTVIRPDPEGGFYLVSFGSNQVQSYNANGLLSFSLGERFEELSRPFDILPVGGKIYVSEYGRDSISLFERKTKKLIKRFGQSGIQQGDLLGPQYLAADSQGYIYVSEWGNQRVSKFDQEGNFILSFGQPKNAFKGLEEPTGITFYKGLIYIADKKKKELDVFDLSGNYLMSYPVNLEGLEGISQDGQERLLLATHKKLYAFEPDNQHLVVLQDLSKSLSKTLFYAYDANNQLLVGDFDSSRIIKKAPISFLYEGLFVRLNRIISDKHPQVRAEVVIEDRYGNPLVGLGTENFILREGDYLLGDIEMEYAGYNAPDAAISFIFDKNINTRNYLTSMQSVIKGLIQSLKGKVSTLSFYSASDQPILEKEGSLSEIQAASLLEATPWTKNSQLDLTFSQAAAKLSKGLFKRAIVYLGSGEISDTAFSQYSLNELVELFKNNSISFYAIGFSKNQISHELEYLARQTGGKVISYARAEGVGDLIEEIYHKKNGLYLLKYTSPNDGELGYKYINLSVEVNFNKRTGSASLGYFAINPYKESEE